MMFDLVITLRIEVHILNIWRKTHINNTDINEPNTLPASSFKKILRSPHNQQSRQDMYENPFNPRRHSMCLWGSKVHVENNNCDADAAKRKLHEGIGRRNLIYI